MNFFEHQDQARKNTTRLIVFFSLAVLSLIAITTVFVSGLLYYFDLQNQKRHAPLQNMDGNVTGILQILSWDLVAGIALVVITVVLIGSLYKLMQLSGGGEKVAESLGGKRLQPNTSDPSERKLLNVVEEMAIASGTPVPPVFLLEEAGVNAFAAGYDANDAVIGVTRGCMELLDREELQGVIAHEFSHILHGDMRINIRLIGILHGILIIGLLGSILMRSGMYSSMSHVRSKDKNGTGIMAVGLGLVVIGYAGTFFGKLIKAAVSRQREFLADASAVQFTRNPNGISQALQKIGGYSRAAEIRHPNAEEFSHMYFGEAVLASMNSMMATHPPLETRIKRITPNWKGEYIRVTGFDSDRQPLNSGNEATSSFSAHSPHSAPQPHSESHPAPSDQGHSSHTVTGTSVHDVFLDNIGNPSPGHLNKARQLLKELPAQLQDAAHDPFAARAIIYSLLMQSETADEQWQQLQQRAHPVVYKLTQELQATVAQLPREQRLPLFILSIPALKTLSAPQYQVFKENLVALIKADRKVDTFEWALYRMLVNALETQTSHHTARATIQQLGVPCQQLISTLATAGHTEPALAEAAYNTTMKELKLANLPLLGDGQISFPMLDGALQQLQMLKPLQKPALLKAMITCIQHDGTVDPQEYELFRAIADCLDCPVPPML
ncbi:M48 family metallopeptidase [Aestuariicella hydrocarbonica]|uniref:M48 family metallopeptidase n=1 Tax=Pseudomaricurvus hydrocarbonicus TaxID=1470433 RepID=A0A9E5MG66_9GAMM|nr:M48 family metallopeptidase [Aestuariicella hydrocarbonica]NHO64281.1 M48 family metallopeptidase [Aestuariicella hydrocarbonica]